MAIERTRHDSTLDDPGHLGPISSARVADLLSNVRSHLPAGGMAAHLAGPRQLSTPPVSAFASAMLVVGASSVSNSGLLYAFATMVDKLTPCTDKTDYWSPSLSSRRDRLVPEDSLAARSGTVTGDALMHVAELIQGTPGGVTRAPSALRRWAKLPPAMGESPEGGPATCGATPRPSSTRSARSARCYVFRLSRSAARTRDPEAVGS